MFIHQSAYLFTQNWGWVQAIAKLVERWVVDYFLASQTLAGSVFLLVARIGSP